MNTMPTNPESVTTQPRRKWSGLLVILALVGLVGLPVLVYGWRSELPKWALASIVRQYESGEEDAAKIRLEELAGAHKNDQAIQLQLAEWLTESDPERSFEICERILEKTPNDVLVTTKKIELLVSLERFDDALALHKELNKKFTGGQHRHIRNNNLAYFRALASDELDRAIVDMDTILAFSNTFWKEHFGFYLDEHERVSVLAAICNNEFADDVEASEVGSATVKKVSQALRKKALKLLNDVIDLKKREILELQKDSKRLVKPEVKNSSDQNDESSDAVDKNQGSRTAARLEQSKTTISALYSLRAKIYEELGREEDSKRDIQRVVNLDFDPNVVLKKLPSGIVAADRLDRLATFLDTRACVHLELRQLDEALADANAAVLAQRTYIEAISAFEIYHFDPQVRDIEENYEQIPRKDLATLLLHRSLIHFQNEEYDREKADLDQIRSLGFEPGPSLH